MHINIYIYTYAASMQNDPTGVGFREYELLDIFIYICIHVYAHVYKHIYTYICIHVYAHAYKHIYTYIYIMHTQNPCKTIQRGSDSVNINFFESNINFLRQGGLSTSATCQVKTKAETDLTTRTCKIPFSRLEFYCCQTKKSTMRFPRGVVPRHRQHTR